MRKIVGYTLLFVLLAYLVNRAVHWLIEIALPLSLLVLFICGGMLAFRYWKNKRDWR
ncbi:hypothetical protein [Streptococcus sinensis]|uniref:hypothetical protein n=1 Tax=Streptococcus sinensis TaxID=176090 RepID=UPI001C2E6400|nr:hypothetical protein [Streptococcus sinensis]MDU1467764.1 hypothetical protein [Streptococcus mitis]